MTETENLEKRLVAGNDPHVLGQLLLSYQARLERIVRFRMDPRLKSRVDASDILQDVFVEATQRIEEYRTCSDRVSFFLWIRFLTLQKLAHSHRHHLGVQARDVNREVSLATPASPQATSLVLAAQLLGKMTSPSNAAMREERKRKLEQGLEKLEAIDREVLALRHFEHLSNRETAQLLQLTESAACNRYFRAIKRLKVMIEPMNSESGFFAADS